ncbi:hypothetical protein C0585_00145 [Candidatus Woesearchaeota archaeon]|nr:MAG: hypothetical protein C0585_00145 [Candidatus Woesearchaeota archaeon]
MVLESLITPQISEKHPKQMFFFGAIFAFIAVIISYWVFYQYSSLVMVFLTTIAAAPLIYNLIKYEEEKDTQQFSETNLLKEHLKALKVFLWLFIGVTIMFSIIYLVVPSEKSSVLFEAQIDTLIEINPSMNIQGQATGSSVSTSAFQNIFFNNIRVLVFCILFSFLYGIGALFILNWNASVIAAAIGNVFRESFFMASAKAGGATFMTYITSAGYSLLRFSIHGIPEIFAYIIAGFAGGIISVAIIKYDFSTKNFEKIIFDTSNLLIISFIILFLAAILEVYVTPIFI